MKSPGGSRPGLGVATWLEAGQEEMMSRHPLVSRPGLASVRSRPGLVSRPGHCSGNCLDTVHGHCSQFKKKRVQNFLKFSCG